MTTVRTCRRQLHARRERQHAEQGEVLRNARHRAQHRKGVPVLQRHAGPDAAKEGDGRRQVVRALRVWGPSHLSCTAQAAWLICVPIAATSTCLPVGQSRAPKRRAEGLDAEVLQCASTQCCSKLPAVLPAHSGAVAWSPAGSRRAVLSHAATPPYVYVQH
jgi:hypothetical protein